MKKNKRTKKKVIIQINIYQKLAAEEDVIEDKKVIGQQHRTLKDL